MDRIPADPSAVGLAVDLGCGTGEITEQLAERYSGARVIGLDSSDSMLAKAAPHPRVHYRQGDIERWEPDGTVDVLYTNAALQWVGDHPGLMPRLMGFLRPGGIFACQIPLSYWEPVYEAVRTIAGEGPWSAAIQAKAQPIRPILKPEAYYEILARFGSVDLWQTRYYHVLHGPHAVFEFIKGTGLKPYLDVLAGDMRGAFEATVRERLNELYPASPDGTILFPFPRLFWVVQRA